MFCLSRVRRRHSIAPASLSQETPKHASNSRESFISTRTWKSSSTMQTHPIETTIPSPTTPLVKSMLHPIATSVYHWVTCLFMVGLVCSQLLGAFWGSTLAQKHLLFGRSPRLGPYQIVGTNDVPYPDRVIACVRGGRSYTPRLVSSLLAEPGVSAILEDSTGTAMHGYRLRQRGGSSTTESLDSLAEPVYTTSCNLIASTIENIFQACLALGYTNLTRDNLRVVDDWDSNNLYVLPDTLPVLIMPFWDNALYARHVLPTWTGDACAFRLQDAYASADSPMASFRGINQSVRYERTIAWLNRPGGYWKNGWYEDSEGMRWYSDAISSAQGPPFDMMHRVFDMRSGKELDCSDPDACEGAVFVERWGNKFSSANSAHKFTSVYIANGTEYGLFLYESHDAHIVHSIFDWETLLSNVYTGFILYRWTMSQVLIAVGAYRGKHRRFGSGISCVSGSKSFKLLLLASLPHLKMTLSAFWTVGCEFEGQQGAFAEAWFAIYPAIAQLMLIYYSILNLLAKILRRRVSDALFTPSVIVLCLLHYFRLQITESGILSGVDGRVMTVVFSDEVTKLQLRDYFTTDIAWRMNGRVMLIFVFKLCILGVNLLPLLLARPFPIHARGTDLGLRGVERALALRVGEVGGLNSSPPYRISVIDGDRQQLSSTRLSSAIPRCGGDPNGKETTSSVEMQPTITSLVNFLDQSFDHANARQHVGRRQVALVNSLELVRVGYLVFGDMYITTFEEWGLLSAMSLFRVFCHLGNHRVLVWVLRPPTFDGDAELAGGRSLECLEPQMWRLDDPRLRQVHWWQISTCSIQC